jgi:hypothetical protein
MKNLHRFSVQQGCRTPSPVQYGAVWSKQSQKAVMSHMKTCDYSSSRLVVIGQQFNSSKIKQNYRTRKSSPKNFNKIAKAYALLGKSYCNPIRRLIRRALPQVHHQQLRFSHLLDGITQAFTP